MLDGWARESGVTGDRGADEPAHMWRLVAASFDGVTEAEYVCELCGAALVVPAGGVHPATA